MGGASKTGQREKEGGREGERGRKGCLLECWLELRSCALKGSIYKSGHLSDVKLGCVLPAAGHHLHLERFQRVPSPPLFIVSCNNHLHETLPLLDRVIRDSRHFTPALNCGFGNHAEGEPRHGNHVVENVGILFPSKRTVFTAGSRQHPAERLLGVATLKRDDRRLHELLDCHRVPHVLQSRLADVAIPSGEVERHRAGRQVRVPATRFLIAPEVGR
mmetsp:Transcript_28627/g.80631  ORF Transcript_28627/g.80631 Transcript_28627/m.80631 type:complete len:217 (-) Transcript_28627:319-969(-)